MDAARRSGRMAVEAGDVVADDARQWTVTTARLKTVPAYGAADHIAVTATLKPRAVP
ncbi:hypothetical protein AB0F13_23730 [Streptomyces sp. NPDC026206]|uniref:hypothetical protein n=1 Tax=Streptomyces sp. NPDC026206 TaxID=3157089 RepID=UPI003409DF85